METAEEYLDIVRDKLDGPIDFAGQRFADQLSTNALMIVGLISFLIGYTTQNIQYTLYSVVIGSILVFLVVIPPWPLYNKHPEKWLPSQKELANLGVNFSGT